MQGHSAMDIRKQLISMDIHVLWISVFNDPCIDLLWILDPGMGINIQNRMILEVDVSAISF